jgi:uncharacterized protein
MLLLPVLNIMLSAAAISFIGSLLGIGGGVFLVPILVFWLKLNPLNAIPMSLICVLATGISGTMFSPINDKVIRLVLLFEPAALFGALIFAPMAHALAAKHVFLFFSIFIILILFISYANKKNFILPKKDFSQQQKNMFGIIGSFFAGMCSGLFGVGGGIILVPILSRICLISSKDAIQVSLCIIISTSVISLIVHSSLGEVPWHLGLISIIGVVPAGMMGARMRKLMKESTLDIVFIIISLGVAITMLTRVFNEI